jgi:glycosyltransferase involved in cell wall biosynthesis
MDRESGRKIKISAVVLIGGKVNRKLLKKCLDSLSWVNEVVKVETGEKNGGFSDWRNSGIKMAKGDWVLYIDSDEEVTKELGDEIGEETLKNGFSAYAIPRRNYIFGKEFRHGGTWPDYQKRLFLKKDFIKWIGDLHEEPVFNGDLGHLKSPIIHHKDITISEMIDKTNKWSGIEAKLMFNAHHPRMNLIRFFSAGFREFWKRMVVQMAFLDGKKGVVYGLYQVYSRLISYSKLWEMQLKSGR